MTFRFALAFALPVLLLLGAVSPVEAASPPWTRHIAEASDRFGMPEAWIRQVMLVESGGRATWRGRPIRSRAGAIGLMQLMPGTWRAMRAEHGLGSDPDDPRDNILAGTAYLRDLYERFGYPGLFAAYNAGPARYADHLARGTRLPAETVDYLVRVTGAGGPADPTAARAAVGRTIINPTLAAPSVGTPAFADHPQIHWSQSELFFRLGAGPRK